MRVIEGVDALAADVLRRLDELTRARASLRARAGSSSDPGPRSDRILVGISGSPGSGKSTLADALLERWGDIAALVPMDGFHLANEQLARLGRLDRKGAPDTFDAAGYVALLERCRTAAVGGRADATADADSAGDTGGGGDASGTAGAGAGAGAGASAGGGPAGGAGGDALGETIFAPRFVREIEESFAAAIAVPPTASIVLTEGNYLLLDEGPWARLDSVLDVRYHLSVDQDVRRRRLIDRHVSFGKSAEAARAWALGPDEANAERIEATAARADALVRL